MDRKVSEVGGRIDCAVGRSVATHAPLGRVGYPGALAARVLLVRRPEQEADARADGRSLVEPLDRAQVALAERPRPARRQHGLDVLREDVQLHALGRGQGRGAGSLLRAGSRLREHGLGRGRLRLDLRKGARHEQGERTSWARLLDPAPPDEVIESRRARVRPLPEHAVRVRAVPSCEHRLEAALVCEVEQVHRLLHRDVVERTHTALSREADENLRAKGRASETASMSRVRMGG